MIRVLILTSDFLPSPWSGVGAAVARQADALAAQGVEVTVAVGGGRSVVPRAGVQVFALEGERFGVDPRRFDVVHLHSVSLARLALELRRRFDLPLTYTAHALLARELPAADPTAAVWCDVQAQLFAHCDRVVFPSHAEQEAALELAPALAGRTAVVPNAVSEAAPAPAAAARGPLVFAGRFAATKGLDLVADFAPALLAGRQTRLVLAGGHGDEIGARAVRRLEAAMPSRVDVVGWLPQSELTALLRRAELVIVPSRYEPFGLVALEAMQAGAPVLAAAVGGLKETCGPGSGAELVQEPTPAEWRRKAERLLSSRAALARLSRRGPRYVARHYGARQTASKLREVYDAVR